MIVGNFSPKVWNALVILIKNCVYRSALAYIFATGYNIRAERLIKKWMIHFTTWFSFSRRFWLHAASSPAKHTKYFPGITILKPLMGIDTFLEHNLESHFNLQYPKVMFRLIPFGLEIYLRILLRWFIASLGLFNGCIFSERFFQSNRVDSFNINHSINL